MAWCKSLFYPTGTPLWHICTGKIIKTGRIPLKDVYCKFNHKNFTTSIKNGGRWQVKDVKPPSHTDAIIAKHLEGTKVEGNPVSLLLKPLVFTVVFCGASFAGTAIWQYENIRKKALLLLKKNWLTDKLLNYGKKKYTWRQEINKMWNQLTEGQKLFAPICFINVMVFLAWRVKRFQPAMIKYFCSSPYNNNVCLPMLLTTFSHYSLLHLCANMYVLYSFSTSGVEDLGKEQFLGLYLAGGVISSFTSYMYKIITAQPSLSLGASGAIMAMVSYICVKYPDSKLSLVLLPMVVFSAGTGIKFLVGLDLLGALRGWKYFDHAAHLGGSMCGIGWCYWGNAYIWQKREPLLEWWHELRTSK